MADWRSFVARRVSGRIGIDDDVLTGAPGWLWPFWAERQLDPESPAFVPGGELPALLNVTHRNWTLVGNLASPWKGIVDPRGLVTPWAGGWSLDWWIGAEDRWHLPSREAAVRQSLAGGVPVVETVMRIPGGDAVQRVYGLPASMGGPFGELVVVEVENRSPVPVAVAFALRPTNPVGLASVRRIDLEEDRLLVDGYPALLLPRPPAGVAGSTFEDGDVVHRVTAGQGGPGPLHVDDPDGLGQVALVYPLPHRTTVRVALPLEHDRRIRHRSPALPAIDLAALPAPADVSRGWQAQLRRGLRLELPDPRLQSAVEANRGFLLLFHSGGDVSPAPWRSEDVSFLEAAPMVVTLDRFGFHAEAAEVLRARPWRSPGRDSRRLRTWEGHAGGLWAIAEHHRLTGDGALLGELIPAVREGVRLLAGHHVVADLPYEQGFWCVRGLVDGAWLLRLAGDEPAADEAERAATQLRDAITASLERGADRLGRVAMPAAPSRGLDAGMVGSLVACDPLGLLPADDVWVTGTLDVLREAFCLGDAFYEALLHRGLSPSLTFRIAACELEAGDLRAWRRLRRMLDASTSTFTWPEAVHPRLGGGCAGDGHHGGAAAGFLGLVRRALVRETPDGGLALATIFPPEWAGQPLEVHDAPTTQGRISYALRWHGDRPALLWQWERPPGLHLPPQGDPGVLLTVPGLDRSFSTTEPAGEALLAPYRARIPIPVQDAGSA
ncbi:MAG: hypothetical protein QOI86_4998 [Actinomycetota bacterium]|nr:hypothetical protein [Actinomycetota bacterium]